MRRLLRAVLPALLLVPATAGAVVLDPPSLRCATVNVSGDVTLSWEVPADPFGDFSAYQVWHSTSAAGPFALIWSTNSYVQLSQFIAGAGAGVGADAVVAVSTAPAGRSW